MIELEEIVMSVVLHVSKNFLSIQFFGAQKLLLNYCFPVTVSSLRLLCAFPSIWSWSGIIAYVISYVITVTLKGVKGLSPKRLFPFR